MTDIRPDPSDSDERLDEAIAEYMQAAEAGRAPDRREFLARNADVAAGLESFFADKARFERLAEPLAPAPRAQGPGLLDATEPVAPDPCDLEGPGPGTGSP